MTASNYEFAALSATGSSVTAAGSTRPTRKTAPDSLDAGYDALCAAFPAFAACPRAAFLARLALVSGAYTSTVQLCLNRDSFGIPSITPFYQRCTSAAAGTSSSSDCDRRPSAAALAIRVPQLLNPAPAGS